MLHQKKMQLSIAKVGWTKRASMSSLSTDTKVKNRFVRPYEKRYVSSNPTDPLFDE